MCERLFSPPQQACPEVVTWLLERGASATARDDNMQVSPPSRPKVCIGCGSGPLQVQIRCKQGYIGPLRSGRYHVLVRFASGVILVGVHNKRKDRCKSGVNQV